MGLPGVRNMEWPGVPCELDDTGGENWIMGKIMD